MLTHADVFPDSVNPALVSRSTLLGHNLQPPCVLIYDPALGLIVPGKESYSLRDGGRRPIPNVILFYLRCVSSQPDGTEQ